jgi:hypothetical protein
MKTLASYPEYLYEQIRQHKEPENKSEITIIRALTYNQSQYLALSENTMKSKSRSWKNQRLMQELSNKPPQEYPKSNKSVRYCADLTKVRAGGEVVRRVETTCISYGAILWVT